MSGHTAPPPPAPYKTRVYTRAHIQEWETLNTLPPPKVDKRAASYCDERGKEALRVARTAAARGRKKEPAS